MNLKSINITLLLLVIILGLILLYLNKCHDNKTDKREQEAFINALQDSIKHFKDKHDNNVATISVLQTSSAKTFAELDLMDEELKALQATVEDYRKQLKAGSSVTRALLETVTELRGRPSMSVVKGDTLWKDSIAYVYPTFKDTINNKWLEYNSLMSKDTNITNIKIFNEFSAVVGIKKGKPFIDLITENPYSSVKSLRTFQVKIPKPKKWGIGPQAGYGIGNDFRPTFFVGVGVHYNILRL